MLGVGIKGDHDGGQFPCTTIACQLLEHSLVPQVQTVERADRHARIGNVRQIF